MREFPPRGNVGRPRLAGPPNNPSTLKPDVKNKLQNSNLPHKEQVIRFGRMLVIV